MEIEKSKVYEEGCAAIRHYSLALRNIRTIAIAQGFAVLTAVFYLAKEGDFFLSAGASIFGIALTGILYQLHQNYYSHARSVLTYVIDLEKRYLEQTGGPWSAMEKMMAEDWSKRYVRFALNKAMYLLLIFALIGALIFDLQNIT